MVEQIGLVKLCIGFGTMAIRVRRIVCIGKMNSNESSVPSSAEIVVQRLHSTDILSSLQQLFLDRSAAEFGESPPLNRDISYKWGEWTIAEDGSCIYIINSTDKRQCLLLSQYESGFVFYPTDKNPTSNDKVIIYSL